MIIDHTLFASPVTPQERVSFAKRFYPKNAIFGLPRLFFVGMIVFTVLAFWWGSTLLNNGGRTELAGGIIVIAVGLLPFFSLLYRILTYKSKMDRSIKLYRFATANGLGYQLKTPEPIVRSGLIFNAPRTSSRLMYDRVFRDGERPFEIGNFYYRTRSTYRKSETTHTYGFMRIELGRNLPHMLLDSTVDDIRLAGIHISSFASAFSKEQVLKLEGNFNDHFTLYAPKEYETDALYVFTPDLMAHFIDYAGTLNAEIVDNSLYIYGTKPFALDKPETLETLLGILDTVGVKALKQTGNYRDSRADVSGTIAIKGRRLRRGIPYAIIIAVVILILLDFIESAFGN